jgi:hypothetical protein
MAAVVKSGSHHTGLNGHAYGGSPSLSPRASLLVGGLPSIAMDLKCGVCFDLYRKPVRLQCDHSVCFDCAQFLQCYQQLKMGQHRVSINIQTLNHFVEGSTFCIMFQ